MTKAANESAGSEGGTWRKSSYSGSANDLCAELTATETGVALRNSRDPEGPVVKLDHGETAAFLLAAADGQFDDLVDHTQLPVELAVKWNARLAARAVLQGAVEA